MFDFLKSVFKGREVELVWQFGFHFIQILKCHIGAYENQFKTFNTALASNKGS